MIQTILAFLIVGAALIYLFRHYFWKKNAHGSSSCTGCASGKMKGKKIKNEEWISISIKRKKKA